jgi:hypothetical protein
MKILIPLMLIAAMLSGCGNTAKTNLNDFEPPSTLATNPEQQKDGPQDKMIKLAFSKDGMSFISSEQIVSYQANNPDVIFDSEGRILIYYTGWIVGDRLYSSAVAISEDNGKTWIYKYLELTGGEDFTKPIDIDAFTLEDGTIRIFYPSGNPSVGTGIHYAESSDGINFEYKGAVFAPSGYTAKNPTVFQAGGLWHLYAWADNDDDQVWHLTSQNGINFTVYALTSFPINNEAATPANGIWIDDKYHLFLSTNNGKISSFRTKNGTEWMPDAGTRLSPSDKETRIIDSSAIKLSQDNYLMVYTTTEPF